MNIKRTNDIALAVLLAAPALLLCVISAIGHILTERSNPLFVQVRLGKDEKKFKIYKLRTMKLDTINNATHLVGSSSVTRVGYWLRRTKLDELPQLFNVLRGDMSFIGPRPCLPTQNELISARRDLEVFSARPGISGLAQISGVDMSEPCRLAAVDARYLASQSFKVDAWLMFKTIAGDGFGDPADHTGKSQRGRK